MKRKAYFKCVILGIITLTTIPGIAQKKPLDHTVYDSWKSISNVKVTNDGKFSVAVVKEQEGG